MKLLWNTNKNLPTVSTNLAEERLIFWGNYHYENSHSWISDLLSKIQITPINNIENLNINEDIIVVDNFINTKESFYYDLSCKVNKIYLIHLGDESGSEKRDMIYSLCEHIWRSFCFQNFYNIKNISCIPIGYKSFVPNEKIKIEQKKYIWNFMGTTHGSSRYDLLNKHKEIIPNFTNLTGDFAGKNSLDTKKYYEVINDSIFTLVPHGYFHPETYRLYESLECGSIPIVENPHKFFENFLPSNPFPKINNWEESIDLIKNLINKKHELNKLSNEVNTWWLTHKDLLKSEFLRIENV